MVNDSALRFKIFPWNINFETGIELIDEQHKQLVKILNKLALHLANRAEEFVLNEIFDELIDYTDYHFKAEEQIWCHYLSGDDYYLSHQTTHASFINELLELKNGQSLKSLDDVIYSIISFLSKWLAYHILDTDKRMAIIVQSIKNGTTIEQAKIEANNHMNGATKVLVNTVLTMYQGISSRTLDLMREQALRKMAEEALNKSEERWKFILDGGIEDVWDWDIENNKISRQKNEASVFDFMGKTSDNELVSIHPADIEQMKSDFEAHLEGLTEFYTNKHRVLTPNGGWSWVLSRGKVVSRDKAGKALRMVGTHSDITEREMAVQIFRNSKQAIFMTDSNNNIICINPAFTDITGYTSEEAIGNNPKFLASGKHDNRFFGEIWTALNTMGNWSGEIYNKRKNGEVYPEFLMINALKDSDKDLDHYFAIFDDITERKKSEALIFEQANYDPLTKLSNRNMFQDRLQQEIKRSNRSRMPFALLLIDLDHFKDINDTLGHDVGDILLIESAKRIKQHIRDSDTLGRLGGDEFTIIFTEIKNHNVIEEMTQNIIQDLSKPFQLNHNQVHISASIGITLYPDDANSVSELLKNADQAMYLAKNSGRNCYSYFTPSMQEEAQKRQFLLNELRKALTLNQFEVYYQPIINLATGAINKAEALIRWHHPEQGLIAPDHFIPLAEESGLIIDIGEWVYKEATRQIKFWQKKYDIDFQISINKSPLQFQSSNNVHDWIEHLNDIELSTKSNVIEITESFLMEHTEQVVEKLLQLRQEGFEISLDDFGTGYSSLSYLQKFEIDYLKIDRSFVSNLTEHSNDIILCEAIITMAHKLNIKVVAEGIETDFQRQLLSDMHCDFGQGYLFSHPVPAVQFEGLLQKIA